MKRAYVAIAFLAVLSAYLGYRVWDLKKQLYRAEFFVQSGLISAQRTCMPTIDALRKAERLTSELRDSVSMCYGNFDGLPGAKELDAVLASTPRQIADVLENRLNKGKRLPWMLDGPVEQDELPVQYRDGTRIH